MNSKLKQFIQDNKQLIEDNKWFEFFSNYCNHTNFRRVSENNFAELMNMFQAAGIIIDRSVMQHVIYNKTIDNIKLICNTNPDIDLITYLRLWQAIPCSFGYSLEELKQIFNEAAKVCSFEPNKGNTGVVRITKSS